MNKKKLGIVVITKNRYIKGLITDGDLRRVLNKSKREKDLNKIIRNFPLTINESMPASKALGIMNEKKITSLLVIFRSLISAKALAAGIFSLTVRGFLVIKFFKFLLLL